MALSTSKNILVSGNSSPNQELLLKTLSSLSAQVECVDNSAECLARVKALNYDLVITTDIRTPVSDDLQLLRQIREIRPETKVIVMTEESTPDEVILMLREHAFSLFSTPFDTETVAGMISRALEIGKWEDGIDVQSARPEWISLRVQCRKITAERLLQFMRELRMDLPSEERENVGTAFREMLLNAIEHGAELDPDKFVDVSYIRTTRVIIYQIRDPGAGFSFEALPHAAISNAPDNPAQHILYRMEHGLRSGGFGIMIVRELVDELFYNDKGNEVLMTDVTRKPTEL